MEVLTILLLAGAASVPSHPIEVRPADLESFRLEQVAEQPGVEEPQALEADSDGGESFWFRLLGFANYAASGTFYASQEYRESRTNSSWDANPENSMARLGLVAGTTEGLNWSASKLYSEGMKGQAWALRIGQLVTYSFYAGHNFNQGWKRQ